MPHTQEYLAMSNNSNGANAPTIDLEIVNQGSGQPSGTTIRSIDELVEIGHTETEQRNVLEQVANRFSVAITPAMLDLIEPTTPDMPEDPIALQFIPDARELDDTDSDIQDPIGDATHSPLPGIIHRYPDRLLLTPIKVCPVYCRFCFRRETVGPQENGTLSVTELTSALDYIRDHKDIWEVILSGGDPLLLSPRRLQHILAELNSIEHVRVIRIHTRVPAVSPERVSKKLIDALSIKKAVFVVLHSNHAREMTEAAQYACAMLIDNGIPMLSQSVLLKGINDDAATLEQLFRTLVENRIKPYYLHHADKAAGTAHFRTSITEGQTLMRKLRGTVSGLCQPEYVLDIPGGAGKVPVGPAWLQATSTTGFTVSDYNGCQHHYADSPDELNSEAMISAPAE
jgi:lysine 2,3-aminomutase